MVTPKPFGFPKPKPAPKKPNRTVSKARAAKRRQQEAVKTSVYQQVDLRDGNDCRACFSYLWNGGEHHHITRRSQGGKHTTANVCRICSDCHRLEDARKLRFAGSANGTLKLTRYANDLRTITVQWESPCPF